MKSSDRGILIGVAILGLAAAFYFLILSPKRDDAAELETQVTELEAQVTESELAAASGREAKKGFSDNYRELITLGEAVPADADTPSLLTQLEGLSVKAGVDFDSITLASGAGASAAPADPAAATEATAAMLPIGATVGTAGLPVMPYEMEFVGGFFDIADFFGEVDSMVSADGEATTVDGRLLTIDGFTLTGGAEARLEASVTATSYLTPADQGVTAGASPTGPAPDTPTPATTPAPTEPGAEPPVSSAVMSN